METRRIFKEFCPVSYVKYIDAVRGTVISFFIFLVLVLIVPDLSEIFVVNGIEMILTVSTFLYAILYGFFIGKTHSRYSYIQERIAEEDAYWLSLYRTAALWGKRLKERLKELIDKYYIISSDFEGGKSYKYNACYLEEAYDALVEEKKFLGQNADNTYDDMMVILQNIENSRNRASVKTREVMSAGHWAILLVLAGIVLFGLFMMRAPELSSKMITTFLSTALILSLFVLRDLGQLRLSGVLIASESGQEVFELIGKKRYYNMKFIKEGTIKVPKNIKEYRVGLHKPGGKITIGVKKNKG